MVKPKGNWKKYHNQNAKKYRLGRLLRMKGLYIDFCNNENNRKDLCIYKIAKDSLLKNTINVL
jgi:hypothetical protein